MVCPSVSVVKVIPAKMAEPIAVWVEDSGGPKEPCIRWGYKFPMEGATLNGKGAACCKV